MRSREGVETRRAEGKSADAPEEVSPLPEGANPGGEVKEGDLRREQGRSRRGANKRATETGYHSCERRREVTCKRARGKC